MKRWNKGGFPYYIAGALLILDWLSLWFVSSPGAKLLLYLGWIMFVVCMVLIFLPLFILSVKCKVPERKDITHTTIVIDSGIYAIIRHPLYLGWIIGYIAIILFGQHWLVAIIGIAGIACVYFISMQEDQRLVERFGKEYIRYMQKVPRMNFLVGVIRLLRYRNWKWKRTNLNSLKSLILRDGYIILF